MKYVKKISYRSSLQMISKVYFLVLSLGILGKSQQQSAQNAKPPVRIPPTTLPSSQCSKYNYSSHREVISQSIDTFYMSSSSTQGLPSACGSGDWTRAVFLNMSDASQSCPSAWNLITTPVRSCGRRASSSGVCDSVSYPINRSYSSVCGRIIAYQVGHASGFYNALSRSLSGIDDAYLDGVSLTHGLQGSRVHIWSFVGATYEQSATTILTCPCTNTQITWSHQIPSFIINNYFCDTGNPGPSVTSTAFYNDPLWDGQGCGSRSSCCTFNTPPYFSRTLNESTSDALEIRNCYADSSLHEDKLITLIDIYVK